MAKIPDLSTVKICEIHPDYMGSLQYKGDSYSTLTCPICKRAGSIDWKQIENDKKVLESLVQQGKKLRLMNPPWMDTALAMGMMDTAQNILDCWNQWAEDGDSLAMQAADNFLHATVEAVKPRMIECGMEVPK